MGHFAARAAPRGQGQRPRFSPATCTPRSSSSCCSPAPTTAPSRYLRQRRSSTRPCTTRRRTSAGMPSTRSKSRWASRSSSATTRARPASRRSTCATPTLSMADNVMTFRYVVKEVALSDGVKASFMPQDHSPSTRVRRCIPGISLFEGENNAFYSADEPLQLSDTGKSFIAGILEHAAEMRGDQPVGELLQAAGARRRGAEEPRRGASRTVRRWCGCRCTRRARRRRVASRCAAPTPPATRTSRSPCCCRSRPARRGEELRPAPQAEDNV